MELYEGRVELIQAALEFLPCFTLAEALQDPPPGFY